MHKEYMINCPILKKLTPEERENITTQKLFNLCYKEYIQCEIANCPRRLV